MIVKHQNHLKNISFHWSTGTSNNLQIMCNNPSLSSPWLRCHLSPFPSGPRTEDHRPIQSIYRVKVQSRLPFSPKSSKSSLLLLGKAFRETGQSLQVQPGTDDSLSSAELSSSCVALSFSAHGFPRAAAAATPLTTQAVLCCRLHRLRSMEMNTKKWDIQQFVP